MKGIYVSIFKKTIKFGIIHQIALFISEVACAYLVSVVLSVALSEEYELIAYWGIAALVSILLGTMLIGILVKVLERNRERDTLVCKKHIIEGMIDRRIIIDSEGEMDTKLTGDVDNIQHYFAVTYPKMIAAMLTSVVVILIITITDYRLSIIFLCMGMLQLLPGVIYEKWTKKVYMNTMTNEEVYTDWMLEGLKGIRTIKSYMQGKWFLNRFRDNCRDMIDAGKKENRTAAIEDIISEFIKTVLTYGSYIVLGIFALEFGTSIAVIPILVVLANTLFSGIDAIVHAVVGRTRCKEAINRIGEQASIEKVDETNDFVIDAVNLCKSFGDKVIFEDVKLHISSGDKVLLRGKNGSGKTTLMRVLLGFDDLTDGILKRKNVDMAYSFQEEPELNLTARSIVAGLDDEKMIDLSLFETIMKGFNNMHIMDKKPEDCSGGERKKFYLALTLARRAEFIVLDEPTNHLDSESVEYLVSILRNLDTTVFVCTHDERIALSWDKRLQMEGGRLNEA